MTRLARRRQRGPLAVAAIVLVLVLVGALLLGIDLLASISGAPGSGTVPRASASRSAPPATTALSTMSASTPAVPWSPAISSSPGSASSAGPGSSPPAPPDPSSSVLAAPVVPAGFRVRGTVVAMGFPLRADVRYRFGDRWRAARAGVVYPYNQVRAVTKSGGLLRGHDGVDLQVPIGSVVLAPVDGIVVDPRPLWKPWDSGRFGKVVVIHSIEPTSRGYFVILAHLLRQSVAIGAIVQRGQVVGRTGRSGNAAGTVPHLHIEIRAPFLIRYRYAGVTRRLDVFDIEPSLRAADPNAR